jgi:hypothetical protein
MHTRRIAAFLLGAWLFGTVLMAVVARESFAAIEGVLVRPASQVGDLIRSMGVDNARLFLQYYAASQRQIILNYWEWTEIIIGAALAAILFSAKYVNRLAASASAVMVLLVLFLHFVIAPEVGFIERNLAAQPASQHNAGMLGGVYSALDAVKFAIGTVLAVYLFTFKNGSRYRVRRDLDSIDYADHSHVNR